MRRPDFATRLREVRLLAMDVDGVLTDGQIMLGPDGREWKCFFSRDGVGLNALHRAGLQSAFVTARGAEAVRRRAAELGVRDVVLNADDKRRALQELCNAHGLQPGQVAFIGDDLQDLGALLFCGASFSVPGCPEEVAARVDHVTLSPGGRGAVREVVEIVLKAQDRWAAVLADYVS